MPIPQQTNELPEIEWIQGRMPWSTYVGMAVALVSAFTLGWFLSPLSPANPKTQLGSPITSLFTLLAFGLAAGTLLAFGLPRGGTIGLSEEGVIIELGTRRIGRRFAFRWVDVRVEGHRMIFPLRWDSPRYILLNESQLDHVRKWVSRGVPASDTVR